MHLEGLDEMACGKIKKGVITDIRESEDEYFPKLNRIQEAPMNNPTDSASFNLRSSSSLC